MIKLYFAHVDLVKFLFLLQDFILVKKRFSKLKCKNEAIELIYKTLKYKIEVTNIRVGDKSGF